MLRSGEISRFYRFKILQNLIARVEKISEKVTKTVAALDKGSTLVIYLHWS